MEQKEQKEYQKLKLGEINREAVEDNGELMEDDLLTAKMKKQKEQKERQVKSEQERKLEEQNRRERAEHRRKEMLRKFYPVRKFIAAVFSLSTYIKFIQSFEELLLVIFIDALMLFTLVSLGYIIYMMFTAQESQSMPILIFKASAGIVVCSICLIAQANLPDANKSNREIQEYEG